MRSPHSLSEKYKYLQDIFHSDVHLEVLLTVSLQPVVGEAVIIRCGKQIAVYKGQGNYKRGLYVHLYIDG